MINKNELEEFCNASVEDQNIDGLVDLKDVSIDNEAPLEERAESFAAQVNNPYLFKADDVVIKVEFLGLGALSEMLARALSKSDLP